MKKYLSIFALAAAAFLLPLGCDKNEETDTPDEKDPPVIVEDEGKIRTDVNALAFGDEAETLDVEMTASLAWTASCSDSWVSVKPASGEAGTFKIGVSVEANEGDEPRSATVTLTCGKATAKIAVVQVEKGALVVAADSIPVPAEGGSIEIRVNTNRDVTAETDADWITDLTTKAMVERVFTFAVAANEAYEPREGHITFSSVAGSKVVTIAQEAAEKPVDPVENPFGNDLPTVTETTTWAGSVFDAIVTSKAGSEVKEWVSPDGENFIDTKLGYLAGFTKGTNAETGEETTTYGKFKFKIDETAYTSGTKMSRVQFGGTGVLGKRNNLIFKVNGAGALTLIARSSGDAERFINVAVNGVPVSEEGFAVPGKADDAKTLSMAVTAADGDLVYVYSMGSGINLYSMKWVPGGEPENPENPENPEDPQDPPTPGEGDEYTCPDPPTVGTVELDKLYGYAAAANVTGGEGASSANVLHFNSGKALQTWLLARTKSEKKGDHSPVIIWLSGTFKPDDGRDFSEAHPWFDVKDVSNLSFYGTDGFVMDRIGIFCVRASNIIIRNINFQQPKANNGADAVSMQECDGVWVDHCTFTSLNQAKDYEDGSTDVTHGSKNVTVSWCRYIKTQKSCLVGHSNSQSGDTQITATFHHNWFEASSSRHPRVRFGKVHVYNNLFDGNTTYGVGSAYGARVLVEYNYFDGVRLPTDICTYPAKPSGSSMVSNLTGSVAGYLYATEDVYVNKPDNASDPYPFTNVAYTKYGGTAGTPLTYSDFKPAYDYIVTAAEDVPTVVKAGAGYGKLGWSEAPVEVNNGGITDFDSTDDNPTDPDPEDPDDPENPEDPGDGSAHTYTLSMQAKAPVQTKDGTAGANYFDCSSSVADFSKDYSGSFTIGGTTYTQGFKMDSKGYVNFTTSAEFTTTVQFYFVRRKSTDTGAKMQLIPEGGEATVWETAYDSYTDSGVVTLEKGTAYTIKQKSSEQALILVVVKESE